MRQSLIRFVLVVTCGAGLALPSLAQAQFATGLEVADYKTVGYLIERLSDGAAEIGLTENRLQTRVELRLRQAGLAPVNMKGEGPSAYLYVQVSVVGGGFSVNVSFDRTVSFLDAGREYTVYGTAVWGRGSIGTHGGDSEFIVGRLDGRLDIFLNEYLKVNQG